MTVSLFILIILIIPFTFYYLTSVPYQNIQPIKLKVTGRYTIAPYVTVSLLILIILVVPPPFILLLYPTKTFSRVLTKLKVTGRYTIALETFVEKFYGCYTNGLSGMKDTGTFSAIIITLQNCKSLEDT